MRVSVNNNQIHIDLKMQEKREVKHTDNQFLRRHLENCACSPSLSLSLCECVNGTDKQKAVIKQIVINDILDTKR